MRSEERVLPIRLERITLVEVSSSIWSQLPQGVGLVERDVIVHQTDELGRNAISPTFGNDEVNNSIAPGRIHANGEVAIGVIGNEVS